MIKCLKTARRLGTVIIITNAESGWVEVSKPPHDGDGGRRVPGI